MFGNPGSQSKYKSYKMQGILVELKVAVWHASNDLIASLFGNANG
jgi:hypothetical protein